MWNLTGDPSRWLAAASASLAYGGLCLGLYAQHRKQRRLAQQQALALSGGERPLLIAYASQTGQAQALAQQAAAWLHPAGWGVTLAPLNHLTPALLQATQHALFIASTYGEGDPPDNASLFDRQLLPSQLPLSQLRYGLLALGDSQYAQFCGFGRALDGWLQAQGASPWFQRVEVDNAATDALAHWQQQVGQHLQASCDSAPGLPEPSPWRAWTLAARQHLNPGSQGGAVFHLELALQDPADSTGPLPLNAAGQPEPLWQSGDLLDLCPPEEPTQARSYSIASSAADGRIHLLVRQTQRADGSPGLASHWLTQGLAVGDSLQAQLRAHPGFRLEDNAQRPLILVGNGTGLAGLRGHLRARVQAGQHANWLIAGERQAAHDQHYGQELDSWLAAGQLQHLDWVFSRDGTQRLYVQHRLREQAQRLRHWLLEQDAALYVCGSLQGMAQEVDTTLRDLLGDEAVDTLLQQGRYRRDVY